MDAQGSPILPREILVSEENVGSVATQPSRSSVSKPVDDEKVSLAAVEHIISAVSLDADEDDALRDLGTDVPFPVDPDAPEEQQFTFRAVFVGCALGAVISASKFVFFDSCLCLRKLTCHSVYLGLKTGWTFGASLFGSIFGFAILKPLSKVLSPRLGGGYFGPKENVCCQSAATVNTRLVVQFVHWSADTLTRPQVLSAFFSPLDSPPRTSWVFLVTIRFQTLGSYFLIMV